MLAVVCVVRLVILRSECYTQRGALHAVPKRRRKGQRKSRESRCVEYEWRDPLCEREREEKRSAGSQENGKSARAERMREERVCCVVGKGGVTEK